MSATNSFTVSLCAAACALAAVTGVEASPVNCVDNKMIIQSIVDDKTSIQSVLLGAMRAARPTTDPELLNVKSTAKGTFASSPALDNGGWIDGIYECDATLDGATERVLLSMNGKADGRTIYAVASMKTHYEAGYLSPSKPINQSFRGYGIGSITAAGYTGTTWNGQPFTFSLLGLAENTSQKKYDVLRIKGSVGIDASRTAQLVCKTDRALF